MSAAALVEGLSHITWIVTDLDRSTRLFTEGLGGRLVYDSGARTFSHSRERFLDVGGLWIALMEGKPLSERSYNHAAFKVADAGLDAAAERLIALGLEVRPPRPRVAGEGRSVYLYDWDNHLIELHSGTLAERLARYDARYGAR